jgi:hypothetical protein
MTTETTTTSRPWPATAVGVISLVAAAASLLMTLAHLGISIPVLLEAVTVLPPVAIGFAVATLLCVTVAVGAFRTARWGWWAGVIVFGLAVLVIAGSPARNWVSYTVLATAIANLVILLITPGRRAFGIGES